MKRALILIVILLTACVPEAPMDAGPDAGRDAGFDAGLDAALDAGFDAGFDGGPDAGPFFGPAANLLVESVSCESPIASGQRHACSFVVRNDGQLDAPAFDSELRLRVTPIDTEDIFLGECPAAPLASGEVRTLSCTLDVPLSAGAGPRIVGIVLDEPPRVRELNEGDNFGGQPVTLQPPGPDLLVDTMSCPSSVAVGTTASCTVAFRNAGVVTAGSFSYAVRVGVSPTVTAADPLLATCAATSIDPREVGSDACVLTIPSWLNEGPAYIGVFADSFDAVVESIETNNTASLPVTITP